MTNNEKMIISTFLSKKNRKKSIKTKKKLKIKHFLLFIIPLFSSSIITPKLFLYMPEILSSTVSKQFGVKN